MPRAIVTECLERARACAELADRASPKDRPKILEIATAWLKLADDAAKEAIAKAPTPTGGQG